MFPFGVILLALAFSTSTVIPSGATKSAASSRSWTLTKQYPVFSPSILFNAFEKVVSSTVFMSTSGRSSFCRALLYCSSVMYATSKDPFTCLAPAASVDASDSSDVNPSTSGASSVPKSDTSSPDVHISAVSSASASSSVPCISTVSSPEENSAPITAALSATGVMHISAANNNATCFFFIRKTLLFLDLSVLKKAPCKM